MKSTRKVKLSYFTALCVCFATAQVSLFAVDNNIKLNEVQKLQEITITATRTNSEIVDVAASVELITSADIERNMAINIEDIFRYTPGITTSSDFRFGLKDINIRGMEGSRIKVLIDGVPQGSQFNTQTLPSAHGTGSPFVSSASVNIDTDMLKTVEIIKGSASSLHGSDAIGGVVAFETKDPMDLIQDGKSFGGYGKFNYSSKSNTFSESLAVAGKIGEVEALLAYTRRDGNEFKNFGNPQGIAETSTNNLLLKLQQQVNDRHRLEFTGNYLKNGSEGVGNFFRDFKSDDTVEQYQVGLKHIWTQDLTIADLIQWQFDYTSKDSEGFSNIPAGVLNIPASPRPIPLAAEHKVYTYNNKGYNFDIQLNKALKIGSNEHNIIYGATYGNEEIENTNVDLNPITSAVVDTHFEFPFADETSYGLFLQDEITVGNLSTTIGVRYDNFETDPGDATGNPSGNLQEDYRKVSNDALTGKVALVYKLPKGNSIFAQVSQGFRAPEFRELFYSFTHSPTGGGSC